MPQRYILNSAVVTAFGRYDYLPVSEAQARAWLAEPGWISTVGYPETARAMAELFGCAVPVDKRTITMQPGDEALVFRLVFPPGTPRIPADAKGRLSVEFVRAHHEVGLLRRVS
jgi:hypothetical protein